MLNQRKMAALLCLCFILGSVPSIAFSQQVPCLQQLRLTVKTGAWNAIADYFSTLGLGREPSMDQLLSLRVKVVQFLKVKQNLIEIVEAHISGLPPGSVVSADLHTSRIPELVRQLDLIAGQLDELGRNRDMFVKDDAFKKLVMGIDLKRTSLLCQFANQNDAMTPNISELNNILQILKNEVKEIYAADDALSEYLRGVNK